MSRFNLACLAFASILLVAPRGASADPITLTAEFTATSPIGGGFGFGGLTGINLAQSFLPLVSGRLVSFDLRLERPQPELGTGTLTATVYRTSAGVPTGDALGAQIYSGFIVPTFASWVTLSGFSIPISAGEQLAIALSGSSSYLWYGMPGNLYAGGTRSVSPYDPVTGEEIGWRVPPGETDDLNFRAFVDLDVETPPSDPPAPTPEPGTLMLFALGGAAAFKAGRNLF